jgi:hypothetical protein
MKKIFLTLLAILFVGCSGQGSTRMERDRLITQIVIYETEMLEGYYSEKGATYSAAALKLFLNRTSPITNTSDGVDKTVGEMLHAMRALARARLEFIEVSEKSRNHLNLEAAVGELRLASSSNLRLSSKQLAHALLELVRGDVGQVSWLSDDEAFYKLAENVRYRSGENGPEDSGP